MTSGDRIAAALHDALFDCDGGSLALLHDEIITFRQTYPRSYEGVKKHPFARKLLEAIEEAIEATLVGPEV